MFLLQIMDSNLHAFEVISLSYPAKISMDIAGPKSALVLEVPALSLPGIEAPCFVDSSSPSMNDPVIGSSTDNEFCHSRYLQIAEIFHPFLFVLARAYFGVWKSLK